MSHKKENNSHEEPNPKKSPSRLFWIILAVGLATVFLLGYAEPFLRGEKEIPYSAMKEKISNGEVKSVLIRGGYIVATPTPEALKEGRAEKKPEEFEFNKWRSYEVTPDDTFIPLLESKQVEFKAEPTDNCGDSSTFLMFVLLPLLFLFLFFKVMRGMTLTANDTAQTFAHAKVKMTMEEGTGVTFADVAGCDEAKHELEEVVDFLKDPTKYTRLGGKVPKGLLLVGPPGTGKTLLGRAVAGEAKVPFFSLSGSDFVEMFVGVGAARVRDLFERAKKHAPCIIFIDEIDAIGKSRQAKGIQGSEEREQTLNALLVEMDGFQSNSNVILIGATNRPEVLDPALLRPGRFDRQVVVDRPDVKGRTEILKVHAKTVVIDPNIEMQVIAKQTPGFSGADLANVINEAALLAARSNKECVSMEDINEAIERVIAGLQKKNRRLTEQELDIVAYHESGHAIVIAALDSIDRVHKISIVSRGIAALGYTMHIPHEERYLHTKNELFNKICGLLGGRAAEEIIFGEITTGASNDLERVTKIARSIVIRYGMSDTIGHINYVEEESMLGHFSVRKEFSEETATKIDHEVHSLIQHLYNEALRILRENFSLLEEMAQYLKREEVLEGEELEEMLHRVVKSGKLRPLGTDGSLSESP